jgi:toxin ParE1/3/4
MAHDVVFAPEACRDLHEILDYIAEDDPNAARRWITRLEERCAALADFPLSGRSREDLLAGLRMVSTSDYLIFYRVTATTVEILTVIHGARDPECIAAKIRGERE